MGLGLVPEKGENCACAVGRAYLIVQGDCVLFDSVSFKNPITIPPPYQDIISLVRMDERTNHANILSSMAGRSRRKGIYMEEGILSFMSPVAVQRWPSLRPQGALNASCYGFR